MIATTSFPGICIALEKLFVPKILVVQLLFLYRYLFVLAEETMRIVRARNMRTFGRKGQGMRVFIRIAGTLFVRTVERSERIYHAMCSRGFNGRIRMMKHFKCGFIDIIFAVVTITVFVILRKYDIAKILGDLILQ